MTGRIYGMDMLGVAILLVAVVFVLVIHWCWKRLWHPTERSQRRHIDVRHRRPRNPAAPL